MGLNQNVILLSIDALRADHLSYHGYARETSPFLATLSERSACFLNAFSASSHTREAVPSLITGQYPSKSVTSEYRLATDSIATMLSECGYRTAAFHSNPYVSRAYGFDAGFDTFYDDLLLGKSRIIALAQRALDKFVLNKGAYHARASEINRRSLDWIDSRGDEPFFLWNHYMDVHGPYNPPEKYSSYTETSLSNSQAQTLYQRCIDDPDSITEREQQLLVDLYDGEIRYLDTQLSDFFSELRSRDLLADSCVVITADHGDAFGEHGYYTHPRRLHDELLHVPLLVHRSDAQRGTVAMPVSTLDVVPTMFDYAELTNESLPGRSLLSGRDDGADTTEDEEAAVISSARGEKEHANVRRFAIRDARWKYLLDMDVETGEQSNHQFVDCSSAVAERQPVRDDGTLPERVAALQSLLETYSDETVDTHNRTVEDTSETDREVEQRLEALGYK